MIKHHPSRALLEEFVSGKLVSSVSVIVASHVEMCSKCQEIVAQLTEKAALSAFEMEDDALFFDESELDAEIAMALDDSNFSGSAMNEQQTLAIKSITDLPALELGHLSNPIIELDDNGTKVPLPTAIRSIGLKEWQGIGKVSRARLTLDDDERRTSLLRIAEGGHVPPHTHKGFEITLLLQGSYTDEMDTYRAGDFIWLDGSQTHTPKTEEGCVCLTVSSDALHFTQGVSQLFNPLGKLIY
ncbi:ChrR family anti-sigma-E factor [Vibrio sp. ZSDE26]|uniref:ChrR family anti-sigma-E factor n=1 Tax=Vibrio amylolyticus TaxID=2847292 RepID=A0A9X2BHS0_9VIBR|nr:ChrR family anti-sigma-E factor [Vibrio amylolyticus]MCK6264214.1 ChrR family anti-sigma-E factor [Vibrio amylolyticus]